MPGDVKLISGGDGNPRRAVLHDAVERRMEQFLVTARERVRPAHLACGRDTCNVSVSDLGVVQWVLDPGVPEPLIDPAAGRQDVTVGRDRQRAR